MFCFIPVAVSDLNSSLVSFCFDENRTGTIITTAKKNLLNAIHTQRNKNVEGIMF